MLATAMTLIIASGRLVMATQSSVIPYVANKTDSCTWPFLVPLSVAVIATIASVLFDRLTCKYEMNKR